MSKLENISALLVVTNSAFTKEAAFTTKTTRAELIRMLQAADFAVAEALEVAENYVQITDQLSEDRENLSAEVQELANSIGKLENKLEREADTVKRLTESENTLKEENENLLQKCSKLQAELVSTNKELEDSKLYATALQNYVNKYKQQGFFDRLFGRTPE